MRDERERWDERYRSGEFSPPESPSPLLEEFVGALPDGRALDVATGNGRNALFLAEQGYDVDAVDVSGEALAIARERADRRDLHVDWIQADLDTYRLAEGAYDVISVSFYHALDLLPDLKESLAPGGVPASEASGGSPRAERSGGVLVYEHHLRSTDEIDRGPDGDRYRFRSNDLLRACLDLTVLHYEEATRTEDGRTSAVVTLVARNSAGGAQRYPRR